MSQSYVMLKMGDSDKDIREACNCHMAIVVQALDAVEFKNHSLEEINKIYEDACNRIRISYLGDPFKRFDHHYQDNLDNKHG